MPLLKGVLPMKMAAICSTMLMALVLPAEPGSRRPLAILGGSVVDTRTGHVLENRTVIVEGGHITRVALASEVVLPSGAQVFDARGRWILPGLIDMHVHGSSRPDVPLALYVANGVTSVRDLGGHVTLLRRVRREVESETRVGPRLFFVGPILDGDPPMAPSISIVVDTPARAVSAVNFLVDQSVNAIKVYNGISAPVLQAIVRTARRRHVPVVGHVPRALTASRAVEIGMDVIEHSPIRAADLEAWGVLTRSDIDTIHTSASVTVREAMVWQHVDLKTPQVGALVAQLAAAKVFLDPTLSVDEFDSLFLYPGQASHPNNRFLKRSLVDEALGAEHHMLKVPGDLEAAARSGVEKRRAFINVCHRAGVRIVAGTDGPSIGSLAPGFGLHRELELLVMAGFTPLDALRAATFDAAAALGHERNLGVIEEGKLADVVIVRADPRLNIAHAAQIEAVVLRGQLLDRKTLDAMLNNAADQARREM
jgi:imidazolonepropionase-like amidohydrolase